MRCVSKMIFGGHGPFRWGSRRRLKNDYIIGRSAVEGGKPAVVVRGQSAVEAGRVTVTMPVLAKRRRVQSLPMS